MFNKDPNINRFNSKLEIPRGTTPLHHSPPPRETTHSVHFHSSKMADQNREGEHSGDQDQSRNVKGKFHYQCDPTEEDEEITKKDIDEARQNKDFRKMMEILLLEEKEKYLLKLAQQGAKLLADYNVETLVTKEEETKNAKLRKPCKIKSFSS